MNPLLDAALAYAARGWPVLPLHTPTEDGCSCQNPSCQAVGKHPRTKNGLKDASTDSSVITTWWERCPQANIGIVTGERSGLVVVDVDPRHGGDDSLAEWQQRYGPPPETVRSLTGGGGWHDLFAHPGISIKTTANFAPGIDIRGEGGYFVAPPSLHASGQTYEWEASFHPDYLSPAPLPAWLLTLFNHPARLSTKNPLPPAASEKILEGHRNSYLTSKAGAMRRYDLSLDAIEAALRSENEKRCKPPLSDEEVRKIARGMARYAPDPPQPQDEFHLTDCGNAQRLVQQHGHELRYVRQWDAWFIWNGQYWAKDQTGEIVRRAKRTVGSLHEEALTLQRDKQKTLESHAKKSEAEARINAMINLAKTEPTIPVLSGALDASPWLLNCLNGTLNLRTGCLHPHQPTELLTKMVPVRYNPEAQCPVWHKFLDRVIDANAELLTFLQRCVGYALTGDTREQVMFLLYGTGANGKTTFLETIRTVLGGYAQTTDMSTFLARESDTVRNDLARLVGARFVSAVEAERGRRFAEVLIKQVTGGDIITARFLFREFFEFHPAFKLFVAVNHKPRISGTDHGMWRRLRLIPFTVTIPEAEQDKELSTKLREELPGILTWAVQGCLLWQQEGLGLPHTVRHATDQYKEEMDVLAEFLSECCCEGPQFKTTAKDLYAAYTTWSEESREKPLSQRAFGLYLTERGLTRKKSTGGRYVWSGIGLRAENTETSGASGP